jgi:hypothetical protein
VKTGEYPIVAPTLWYNLSQHPKDERFMIELRDVWRLYHVGEE